MNIMATLRLNQGKVDALKPRKSAYDVRDPDLKGFGVRTYPSGAKRYFIDSQHQGRRVWKIVGQAGSIGVDEARDRARLVSIRGGSAEGDAAPPETPFETVADEVFHRYARNWKPSTLRSTSTTTRSRSCPGSKAVPSPGSPATTSSDGLHPSAILRLRRTARLPSFRSSCARPRSTATGRKGPIRARESRGTGARGGSASCRRRRSAGWAMR